jgi:hypothetical protein
VFSGCLDPRVLFWDPHCFGDQTKPLGWLEWRSHGCPKVMGTTSNILIQYVCLSVCPSVKVLKPISLLIKLSPWTQGPKNYSGPRVLTSYFYFYVRFRAATAVVDGGGIFGIWRVGEEIWVCFFWAKGLGGSWFLFFSWRGGRGWGWGFRGLNRWKWTGVGNAKDRVGGIDGVHYAPGSH